MALKGKGLVDYAVVRELLDYDPVTGILTWKPRVPTWFPDQHQCDVWNSKHAGQIAFTSISSGYHHGTILDEFYSAHTIIFLWMTGRWPDPEVDHINRQRTDNRWVNLREATRISNGRNLPLRVDNKSGHAGVWQMPNGSFCAYIRVNYRRLHLGCFPTFEAAVAARKAAEVQHGFRSCLT